MDKKTFRKSLIELIESMKWEDLEQMIIADCEETKNVIRKTMFIRDGTNILNGTLKSLSCKSRESSTLKFEILSLVINVSQNAEDDEECVQNFTKIASAHIENLPSNFLIELIDKYLQSLKLSITSLHAKWEYLFSRLLLTIYDRNDLYVNGKDINGREFQEEVVLKSLLDCDWNAVFTISVLSILCEQTLSSREVKKVVDQVKKCWCNFECSSIAPISYNLISLAINGDVSGLAIEVFLSYFNEKEEALNKNCENTVDDAISIADNETEIFDHDAQSLRELIEAQSTVIVHIVHMSDCHPELIKEYLKMIKCTWVPERIFTPFNLTLALSLANISRYKDQILDSVKSSVLKYYRIQEKRFTSCWLSDLFRTSIDLCQIFRSTVKHCRPDWDQVNESMVELCFSLLESGSGLKSDSWHSRMTVKLAIEILPIVFKKEPRLASQIIKNLLNCLFTSSSSSHYVDTFCRLVRASPILLLEEMGCVREVMEQICYLPTNLALKMLSAIMPLVKMNAGLKDALMLLLRKMLFAKEIQSRVIAVNGYVQLLRHFKVDGNTMRSSQASISFSSALSQLSVDVHSNIIDASSSEILCLEVLGIIRRAFTQQTLVRKTFYDGMVRVCQSNSKLCGSVVQLLMQHARSFLDLRTNVSNPIKMNNLKSLNHRVTSQDTLEPLGELIASMARCLWHFRSLNEESQQDDSEEVDTVMIMNECENFLDELTEKLTLIEPTDLNFDSEDDVVAASGSRVENASHSVGEVLLTVYDALTEHNFLSGSLTDEAKMKTVVDLLKIRKRLEEFLRNQPNKKDQTKKSTKASKSSKKKMAPVPPLLSLKVSVNILNLCLNNPQNLTVNEKCLELIESNRDMFLYCLSVIEYSISKLKTDNVQDRYFADFRTAAKLIFSYTVKTAKCDENEFNDRQLSRLKQAISIQQNLFTAFDKYYNDKLQNIFKEITGKTPTKTFESLIYILCQVFCKLISNILKHRYLSSLIQDSIVICKILTTLTKSLDPGSKELSDIQKLIEEICKECAVENSSVGEAIVQILLSLTERIKPNNVVLKPLAKELHYHLGDMEESVVLEETSQYKIVNENTAVSVILAFCNYCDQNLNIIELAVQKIKAMLIVHEKYNFNEVDKMICCKFILIIHALYEVFQSSLPTSCNQDAILKLATKFYNTITLYIKYYMEYYKNIPNAQMSEGFEKLIHFCGNMLKDNTFKMVTYIFNKQLESVSEKSIAGAKVTAQAIKESKLMPALVFAIEHYEKNLMALSKKSKVNLFSDTKMTTSRDFRIKLDCLQGAIAKRSADKETSEAASDDSSENNSSVSSPASKRCKF